MPLRSGISQITSRKRPSPIGSPACPAYMTLTIQGRCRHPLQSVAGPCLPRIAHRVAPPQLSRHSWLNSTLRDQLFWDWQPQPDLGRYPTRYEAFREAGLKHPGVSLDLSTFSETPLASDELVSRPDQKLPLARKPKPTPHILPPPVLVAGSFPNRPPTIRAQPSHHAR